MKIIKIIIFLGLVCLISGCSHSSPLSTFLIDPTALVTNKQRINDGDKVLTAALVGLKAEAEEVISQGPYSVTYKTISPPSGDKHDFMSFSIYWWPDSTKSDGLPYIRKDGIANHDMPAIDGVYFRMLCLNVRLLSVAFYFTGENKYATKAVEFLRVWFLDEATRMNPHLNYGNAIPGIRDGSGQALIETCELVYLIDGIQILKSCNHLTDAEYEGLQSWFAMFLDWMTTSPHGLYEADRSNNHGTYYDIQTVSIALFTGQKENATKMLKEKTKVRINSQFAEDGSQPHELERTRSWSYSQKNLSGFFELARLAENVDMDLWNYVSPDKKSIKEAYRWMLSHAGDQPWEYQQITPMDKAGFIPLAYIAKVKYPDVDASDFFRKYQNTDPLFMLTH